MDNFPTHERDCSRLVLERRIVEFERRIEELKSQNADDKIRLALFVQKQNIEEERFPYLVVSSALPCLAQGSCLLTSVCCNRRLSSRLQLVYAFGLDTMDANVMNRVVPERRKLCNMLVLCLRLRTGEK
jgi:hypothetical protein